MSTFGKILTGVAVAIGLILLMEFVTAFPLLTSIVIGALGGAVVTVLLIAASRGESPEAVAREVVQSARDTVRENPTTAKERAVNEQLFRAQRDLTFSGRAPELVPVLSDTIETLRTGCRRALEFAPESETTFNLTKFATDDLPNQVRAFLALADDDIAKAEADFKEQLELMDQRVTKLLSFIDAGQRDAFDTESTFVDLKFNLDKEPN